MKLYRRGLYLGWAFVACVAILAFTTKGAEIAPLHAVVYFLPLVMITLLVLTGAYKVARFIKGPGQ
jgi:hypothetical protein